MLDQKGSSKADTLVKVVLVSFISLLAFSVGAFVGKQVSDSDHRRMALEGEYKGDRSVASTDSHGESAEAGDKISQKEIEDLSEEFANKEKSREPAEAKEASDEHAESPAAEHAPAAEHKEKEEAGGYKSYTRGAHGKVAGATAPSAEKEAAPAHGEKLENAVKHEAKAALHGKEDGAHKAAEKVAEGKAPTDGKKEAHKPQPQLPSVANTAVGKYAVQLASYPDEGEAKTHAAELKGKGYATAFYLAANVKGKTYYRVLVGLFENVSGAEEYRKQLLKDGVKAAIVQKIVQ